MQQVAEEFRDGDFEFFIVYVREAHPGENYPRHTSWEQKLAHAEALRCEEHVQVPILVDALDGTMHADFGYLPNMIYVVNKQGVIVYRSDWTDADELAQVCEETAKIERFRREAPGPFQVAYSERLRVAEQEQRVRERVYRRSGQQAIEDYRRAQGKMPF